MLFSWGTPSVLHVIPANTSPHNPPFAWSLQVPHLKGSFHWYDTLVLSSQRSFLTGDSHSDGCSGYEGVCESTAEQCRRKLPRACPPWPQTSMFAVASDSMRLVSEDMILDLEVSRLCRWVTHNQLPGQALLSLATQVDITMTPHAVRASTRSFRT